MTDMVERVARAIYESRNGAGAIPWSRRDGAHKAPYLSDAHAAIEAMREPTDAMKRIGVDDILNGPGISAYPGWPELVASRHRLMIDAALSPHEIAGDR